MVKLTREGYIAIVKDCSTSDGVHILASQSVSRGGLAQVTEVTEVSSSDRAYVLGLPP